VRAVILAGGLGRRLAPFSVTFPKPLVPVGDQPILEIVIKQLVRHGFSRATLAVGHLADLLQAYFQDGRKWDIQIDYSREVSPLGTAGPLALLDDLPEHFLVMNGDILTTLDYSQLFQRHIDSGAEVTIATHRRTVKIDYGVLEFDASHRLTDFSEKPELHYQVSMGIYVFSRSVLDVIEKGEHCDLNIFLKTLMDQNRTIGVYPSDDFWLDIGRGEDYAMAQEVFTENSDKFLQTGNPMATVYEGGI
jgi:NDP-sugar pyrophosphorylase family protein